MAVPGNEQLKAKLLDGAYNAPKVLSVFVRPAGRTDDKFYKTEATVLDQTTKARDQCSGSPLRNMGTLASVQKSFGDVKNVQVRDLSNTVEIQLQKQGCISARNSWS